MTTAQAHTSAASPATLGSSMLLTLGHYPTPAHDAARGLPRGLPGDATPAQVAYATRLHSQWRTILGEHADDGHGDIEDFWEQAARLDAALHSGAPRVMMEERRSRSIAPGDWAQVARDITWGVEDDARLPEVPAEVLHGTVVEAPTDSSYLLVHYGPIAEHSPLWARVGFAADRYSESEVFVQHAGRRLAVVGYDVDVDPHSGEPTPHEDGSTCEVEVVMAQWASEGVNEVVVKARRAKHGIWRVPASTDQATNRAALLDALGWSLIHHEGRVGAFLLQGVVPMEYEYRIFIVDGRPVTGAGCIEEHTPLYAPHGQGEAFSPFVRQRRDIDLARRADDLADLDTDAVERTYGTPVICDPDLVARYVDFACEVAAQAAGEGVLPRAYTLDVALDAATGQPLLIEVNGLSNSGLYASRPLLVTKALMTPSVD